MSGTKDNKKTTGTSVGAAGSPKFDLAAAVAAAAALGGSSSSSVPKFTQKDADAVVQNVFQQLLGRNAQGSEYAKALNLALNQDPYTGQSGRLQAVQDYVMAQPEYQARSQDRWLDAIYTDLQKQIARARQ
jgi:hypothetical protein